MERLSRLIPFAAFTRGKVLNTAFIERLNAMMHERLANLTRKCRHAARHLHALHTGIYLIGCTTISAGRISS